MQDRRCVSSANTAEVLPRLGFSQDLPEKISQSCSPHERTACLYQGTCQHLLPEERKGRVPMFWMYREGKTATMG